MSMFHHYYHYLICCLLEVNVCETDFHVMAEWEVVLSVLVLSLSATRYSMLTANANNVPVYNCVRLHHYTHIMSTTVNKNATVSI